MSDRDALAFVIAEVVKAATAPLLVRIAALETAHVSEGPAGKDGKDADPEFIRAEIAKAVAALPVPASGRDGKDGENGKDVDPLALEALVAKAVASLPVPKDGRDGADGQSITADDVAPIIKAEVEKAVASIPAPKEGERGQDGKDGVGLAGAVLGREGDLIVTLSDGTVKSLGVVVGQNGMRGEKGEPGRDGIDGLGFDDLSFEMDGERTFVVKASRGDHTKEIGRVTLPLLIYKDVFKPGQKYEPGDVTTWGNQTYCCREATTTKPGEGPAWRLMVRKGGDGKVGGIGPVGPPGPQGPQGPLAKVY